MSRQHILDVERLELSAHAWIDRVTWSGDRGVDVTITIEDPVTGYRHNADISPDKARELINMLRGESDGQ